VKGVGKGLLNEEQKKNDIVIMHPGHLITIQKDLKIPPNRIAYFYTGKSLEEYLRTKLRKDRPTKKDLQTLELERNRQRRERQEAISKKKKRTKI